MRNILMAWGERLRSAREVRCRAEVVRQLAILYSHAQQLEAEYRDAALAAAVLAPRVAPTLQGLAAEAAPTARSLAGRIGALGGVAPSARPFVPRLASTMWGHLGPILQRERDLIAMGLDGRRLEERDPGTADLIAQVRKDAVVRERELCNLIEHL